MSTYSNQTDYELMELLGLKDLKNSQLILATVVSINRTNNTAEISIAEDCPELVSISLTEVPFFYHCEYSTGTLEELVDGHKAFEVNDFVYCVFIPENGDQVQQFYIVGHADIRQTRMCLHKEYLVVSLSYNLYSVNYDFVNIFDAETGAKIDLEAFENLPNSPAKPASLPCARSAMSAWYNFNFESPIVTFSIYGDIDGGGFAASALNWPDADQGGGNTSYTGDTYNLCVNFSSGNATYSGWYTYDDILYGTYPEPVNFYWHTEMDYSGVTKYELGDTYCRGYWNSFSSSETYRVQGHYRPVITIYSKGTHQIWSKIDWQRNNDITVSISGDTTEIEEANYSYVGSFNHKTYIDFEPIGRQNLEAGFSWSGHASGTFRLPPSWDGNYKTILVESQYSSTQSLGQTILEEVNAWSGIMGQEEFKLHIWHNTLNGANACCKVGRYYVYSLIGGVSAEEWWTVPNQIRTSYRDGSIWPAQIEGGISYENPTATIMKIKGKADTCVTSIYESLTPTEFNQLHLLDCITEADMQKSAGLNSVINELYEYVLNFHGFTSSTETYDLFTRINGGPTAAVRKKKNL